MPMRVAITAAAVRTALGDDADQVWRAIEAGESAVGPIQGFDASGFGDVQAAQIWTEPETAEDDPALRILGPHGRLLDAVARKAHASARLESFAREDVGLFVAMGMVDSPIDDLKAAALAARGSGDSMSMTSFFAGAYRQIHPLWPLSMLNNVAAGQIAIDLDIRGDNTVLASGGSAGARAILEGGYAVDEGKAHAVLAAGVSGRVSPARLARFPHLQRGDWGCWRGEGGAALVLEREDTARERGARPLGFLRAGANAFGPNSIGGIPDLSAMARAVSDAWEAASLGVPQPVVVAPSRVLGDLEAGWPAVTVALVLADWRRAPSEDGIPRAAIVAGADSQGGWCAVVIEEAL